jgi:regulatory protein
MDEDSPEIRPRKARQQKKPPKKITAAHLHNTGLHYLQRFPASTAHFRAVMMRRIDRSCRHHADQDRDGCARLLDELIGKFVAMGLLDDAGYTRGMVNSLRRRGHSGRAIHAKLSARGLPRADIDAALSAHADEHGGTGGDSDMRAALLLARRKRLGPFGRGAERTDRDMAALARAGFGYDIVSRVMAMDLPAAEEYLNPAA